jgi:hypothetical protein
MAIVELFASDVMLYPTEKLMKFEAPLPEDMQNLLELLREYRKV